MRRLEQLKNLPQVIQEKRVDLGLKIANSVTPIDANQPPITRESLLEAQTEIQQVGKEHVIVDFALKRDHFI